MSEFFTYKIRKGDTLSSLSLRTGISPEELKIFHNGNCGKMDKIWLDNLLGVDYILLPLNYISKEEKEKNKRRELPSMYLEKNFYSNLYHITETIEKSDQEKMVINYAVSLDFVDSNTSNYLLQISHHSFKKEGVKPDDKMSSLALACMENTFPIKFFLNQEGVILEIHEHDKIVANFKNKRPEIETFFIGDISKAYLDNYEEKISDAQFFLRQFLSTLLYQTLFPKFSWFYKNKAWNEKFSLINNSFPLECVLEAEFNHENEEFVNTIITGNVVEQCSLLELLKGIRFDEEPDEPIVGRIVLDYSTDKITKSLISANATITLWNEEDLYFKHQISIDSR